MITKEKTISYIFLQLQQVDELIWLLHFICAAAGVMSLQKSSLTYTVVRNWVFKNRVLVLEVPSFSLYGFFAIFHLIIFHDGEHLQCAPLWNIIKYCQKIWQRKWRQNPSFNYPKIRFQVTNPSLLPILLGGRSFWSIHCFKSHQFHEEEHHFPCET